MNYVVVDFEWNQCPYGRGSESHRMPFEIIEIGAVLLDENLQEIDRFSETIRPKLYKKLHHITKDLTGITQAELDRSDPFPYVLVDFMLWCGDEFTFCTWGNTDLVELQRNLKYHHMEDLLQGPIEYFNIQKFFKMLYEPEMPSASLEYAVDYFKLSKKDGFHRAVNDAAYTADVFRQMDLKEAEKWFSVDYYQNPKCKEDEIHLVYDTYYKFVSREFDSKESAIADKEVRQTRCYKCGRTARRRLSWFAGKTKNYYSLSTCPEHGYLRGKIRIKKGEDNKVYAVKTLKLVDEEAAESVRQMKIEVIEKRRERRHRVSGAETENDTEA